MTDKELKNKCKERAKIFQQAMESCKSSSPTDCIEWFADRIAELEKEKCELLGIIQGKDTAIADLKKENAELKERLKRAKEIIKDFVDRDDSCWSIQKKAEEFLKECQ